MRERRAARELSVEIGRVLEGPDREPIADPLVATAQRLADLSGRLPPVPAQLERRVDDAVRAAIDPEQHRTPRASRSGWRRGRLRSAVLGALAATLVLATLWSVAPQGREVWAGMMSSLLGQTRVELTPAIGSEAPSVREPLRDLVAAELTMGRAPALPKTLPEGYALQEIAAVSYPELPAWISQPLFVELGYGVPGDAPGILLREYRLQLKHGGQLSGVQIAGDAVAQFEQVEVSGVNGTLLTFWEEPEAPGERYTVIWERDGMLLELESDCLDKQVLLGVARSVR